MNKWESKNPNEKKNHNVYGTTDYNIPMFSYKSALLIVGVTFLLTIAVIYLTNSNRQAIILTLALSLSLTTSYSQFFIDTNRKLCKHFYYTLVILFIVIEAVLQFVQF